MPSILEVVREYKDLADRKRAEGALPADLAERFAQLEVLVRQYRDEQRAAKVTADLSAPSAPARAASLARPRRDSQPERPAARRASEVRSSPPVRASVDNGVAVLALEVPTPPAELGAAGWWKALQDRLHVPQDPGARRRLLIALTVMSAGLAVACTVMMGADPARMLPGLLVTGGVGWFLVMPLVMATWEFRGRRSNAHISEPDFEVLLPTPEPAVGVLTLLAAMVWVMTSGLPSEGLARTAGYILGLGFGLAAMGMLGMLVLRPVAAKIAVARAYAQYMAGGQHHLARNPRRARRLFERAAQAARSEEEREAAQVKLRAAVEREAAELAERGLAAHASALLQTAEPAPIPRPAPVRGIKNSKTVAPVRPAPSGPVGPPRGLSLGSIGISGAPACEEQSRLLLRGRAREALEAALDARAPVSEALARAAAQEYIAQGCLRSAFTLFEALGEAQIPEFYKALAVEISRALDKPDLPLATRVSQLLDGLGEGESVARLATQVVLATEGDGPLRHDLAAMARRTCESIGARPAGGVLEALGELSEAAAAYEVEGAAEDAQRCLRLRADQLLAAGDGAQAVPILARLFSLDPSLEDEYLAPLVENVIDSGATGSRASKILAAQRRRHPDDVRTLSRRVELFVEAGQVNEARAELDHLAKVSGSSTEQVVQQYQTLVARYPRDAALRAGLCRVLIRVARASDAAQHVARLMESEYRQRNAKELAELIESVYQWGHQDPDLRLGLARVRAEMGMRQEALQVIITYLKEGGRNPEALELGQSLLADELVLPSGAPNHKAHLELAVLNLYAGVPGDAIRLLEVARAGGEQRARAEILLARAHQLASNPGQAVRILVEAIGGRPLRQTPEQHFELARAYEAMGEDARAKKVDAALERAIPGSVRDFRARREVFERADTIWIPPPGLEEPNDTDAGTLGTELG
ncbi:MAG: hypothetical protein KC933_25380, partial [Myxococcales bacterium]|nr:hypothetical protein [Myxococcales bacterium]